MSSKEDDKESKEPDYDEDKDQIEEKKEEPDLDKTKTIKISFLKPACKSCGNN
jgi:hypothetical protein